jgi:hypothetical protein
MARIITEDFECSDPCLQPKQLSSREQKRLWKEWIKQSGPLGVFTIEELPDGKGLKVIRNYNGKTQTYTCAGRSINFSDIPWVE